MTLPTVAIYSLGGTIAMVSTATDAGVTPKLTAEDLVNAVPALAQVAQIRASSFLMVPGAHLTFGNLAQLAEEINRELQQDTSGVVVTQGTDTIEETAFALDLLVDSDKPVVVTGAMRNPTRPGADGPANLLASVIAATSDKMVGQGVTVILNDEVHTARFVRKMHTSSCSAFASPSAGPVGWLAEDGVLMPLRVQRGQVLRPSIEDLELDRAPVALYTVSLGDDGRSLDVLPELGYRGVVVEALGGGHVPAPLVSRIAALSARVPVVLASRAGAGTTLQRTYGFPGSEIDLLARGVIPSGSLDGRKARILLTLALSSAMDERGVRSLFASYDH